MAARLLNVSRSLIAGAIVSAAACTTHDSTPVSQPAPRDAASEDTPVAETQPVAPHSQERTVTLIGVVHEGGTRVCEAETYEEHWIGKHWQIGWTPVVSEPELDAKLATLAGRVVAVTGRPVDEPPTTHGRTDPPEPVGNCPIHQMRSDWRLTPEGVRIPRGRGPDFRAIEMLGLEGVRPLEATTEDGEVRITLDNPLDHELVEVELVAHYEGCYGKPGATVKTVAVGRLAAGGRSGPHIVPELVEDAKKNPRGRHYALRSIELVAETKKTSARAYFDLDLDAHRLGVAVDCPR